MLEAAGATDAGRMRSVNEDALLVDRALGLFAVFDGMGGHAAGERASQLSAATLHEFVRGTREGRIATLPYAPTPGLQPECARLVMALRVANRAVWDAQTADRALAGMGSTAACLLVHDGVAHVAHVGDSRVYLFRGGRLAALTRDHSGQNELVDRGLASQEEAERAADKHVITRAIGSEPDVEPTGRSERLAPGDVLLLTSDGLTDLVHERDLAAAVLARGGDLPGLCGSLVVAANQAGGRDNITVVAVRYAP